MNRNKFASVVAVCLLVATGFSQAQQCEWKQRGGEVSSVTIDDRTWVAVSPEHFREQAEVRKQCNKDLQRLSQRQEELVKIAEEYEKLSSRYEKLMDEHAALLVQYDRQLKKALVLAGNFDQRTQDYESLVRQYDRQLDDWEEHAAECRDISNNGVGPGLYVDLGLGASLDSGDPAALLGMGIGGYKLWGTLQEDNNSLMVGRSINF